MITPVALRCPSCASPLQEAGLDLARGLAKCAHCGALMTLESPTALPAPAGARARARVPLPPRVMVLPTGDGVSIRLRWYKPQVLFLLCFCIFWDGFLVFWYAAALGGNAPIVAILFPLLHVSVGIGLTYFTLASLCNTTEVAVDSGKLQVRHRPLPWRGQRELERGDVTQLYCKQRTNNTRNGPSHSYELWAALKEGQSLKLLGAGLDSEQALFLEQELERALGLLDRQVPGELAH
jgi:hypothetical protein